MALLAYSAQHLEQSLLATPRHDAECSMVTMHVSHYLLEEMDISAIAYLTFSSSSSGSSEV
jgi:hypothetical protein